MALAIRKERHDTVHPTLYIMHAQTLQLSFIIATAVNETMWCFAILVFCLQLATD